MRENMGTQTWGMHLGPPMYLYSRPDGVHSMLFGGAPKASWGVLVGLVFLESYLWFWVEH